MRVFKVPDDLHDKYHGCGHALAASVAGKLVDMVYVEDVLPDYDPEVTSLESVIADRRLAPTVRQLQALGSVHVGMLSCWEFVEL